jgi:alpha-amylase
MKWLTDYISDYGIDGYRVDTVKHTEEYVWEEFRRECDAAFSRWKNENPRLALDDSPFYMVGEIYFYNINAGKVYDFGDRKVNYFDNHSFDAMINFDLRSSANRSYEEVFSSYAEILNNEMRGFSTLNYLTSHDDGEPFDKEREQTYEAANRLLLAPGASQVYYGDEIARSLIIEGTQGDATLRSSMDWSDLAANKDTQDLLVHYQKLGQFRNKHMAVGAGEHQLISETPYVFSRSYQKNDYNDEVVIALDISEEQKEIPINDIFKDGTKLRDGYSNIEMVVTNGKVSFKSPYNVVLLARME